MEQTDLLVEQRATSGRSFLMKKEQKDEEYSPKVTTRNVFFCVVLSRLGVLHIISVWKTDKERLHLLR